MIYTDNQKKEEFNSTKDFSVDRNQSRAVPAQQPASKPQVKKTQNVRQTDADHGRAPVIQNHKPQTPQKPAQANVSGKMMQTRLTQVEMAGRNKESSAPKKTKKSKSTRGEGTNTVISVVKAIVYIMFVIVVAAFIAIEIIKIGNDVFAFVKSDEIIEVTIPENATTEDVAEILKDGGVIEYPRIFCIYAGLRKDDGVYLAGTYSVSPMQNYDTLRSEFKPKAASGTVEITIPEGYSTDEIIDLMLEYGIGTREGYADVIENGDFDYWFVKELEEDGRLENRIYRLDGYLFPDTYQFYLASSEWTVINKLLRRFSQIFTTEYREQCETLGYSTDEIVTLASMIEKEAVGPSEFFLVSSVFHNRLNAKWTFPCFESDATVVYAIAHETGERTVDLNYDSPYNTYKYEGFPPGPISNPSASAMLAALSPQKTNYYFFISNNGQTYFSATKAEHDSYVYQFANENEQKTTGDTPQ